MKAAHVLKLKALESKPTFKFVGNQKGFDIGEIWPLYNLELKGHPLDGSTITAATVALKGFSHLKTREVAL